MNGIRINVELELIKEELTLAIDIILILIRQSSVVDNAVFSFMFHIMLYGCACTD